MCITRAPLYISSVAYAFALHAMIRSTKKAICRHALQMTFQKYIQLWDGYKKLHVTDSSARKIRLYIVNISMYRPLSALSDAQYPR